ncbi:hypothetical protein [Lentzea albidocapillata]|uniref:Uncharacterized protein n=1 Tax=Lentzea albidocapillata TaxID=40571 RepID=A0A1W2CYB7_9PSEU|nr:hypothetical protein [Lentzea albidocapillata]SMC90201.1 hypothetical protein SAMN05660733_02519 [Lentzea albidocapillata]
MATEILTEDLLRVSLVRLSREVVKTYPEFGDVLTQKTMRTCELIPDSKRAEYFHELGVLLIDLGRLYLAESDILAGASEETMT